MGFAGFLGSGTTLADPLSGGLSGLAKTAAHEWPEVACKAVDLGQFPSAGTAAAWTGPMATDKTPSAAAREHRFRAIMIVTLLQRDPRADPAAASGMSKPCASGSTAILRLSR